MLLNGTQTESAPRTYFIPASSLKEKPPKSLFNIHHYYTKSIKYFFFIINLYSDLGGLSFYEDNTGKYVVGADSVPKKLGSDLKTQTKSATYPMAGVNGEQTVDFSVVFDGISGYKLAYAGIQQLNTYISNGTIKYVEFTSQRISGNTVTWSVHTQRGTGGGNNTCVVQGIFVPT